MNELKKKIINDINNKLRSKKEKYRNLYKKVLKNYNYLYELIEPDSLKCATGPSRDYQIKLFDFCKSFLNIFDKLGLQYFPVGGTLVGAVRHKGFIPWDDDFDVGMMRSDYEALKSFCKNNYIEVDASKICYSENNKSEIWQEYMTLYPNQIIYSITPNDLQIFCGTSICDCVNIDIFCHDYYREDYSIVDYVKYIKNLRYKLHKLDNWKLINEFLHKEYLDNPNIVEKSSKIFYSIDNMDSWFFKHSEMFDESDIFPLKKINFEDIEISVQNNFYKYAKKQYRDYEHLPEQIILAPHISLRNACYESIEHNTFADKLINQLNLIKKYVVKNSNDQYTELRNMLFLKLKLILKKLSVKDKYYELYKNKKEAYDFLLSIIDTKKLKPAQGELREYQLKLFDFSKSIIKLIEKNGLNYFITSGTLIGAVRHGGFVPWDDDIDICMMRKDYEQFFEYCEKNWIKIDNSNFYTSEKNRYPAINELIKNNPDKILYNRTHYYIQLFCGTDIASAATIDIFPMDFYDEDYSIKDYSNEVMKIKQKMVQLDNHGKIYDYIKNLMKENNNIVENSNKIYYGLDDFMSYFIGSHKYWFERSDIFPLQKVCFEGEMLNAPANIDKYLSVQHPEYMNLPQNFEVAPVYELFKNISSK